MESSSPSESPFLELPAPIRQKIYFYLLAPDPAEVTTINYTLRWTWLDNPSNSTFAAIPQFDLCRCPQSTRTRNTKTIDHIYTRYQCYGPEVRFNNGSGELWVPSASYLKSRQINFLRPATECEYRRRPNANVLGACKTIYEEALPTLYRERNLLFLTGPCPRGRYQAYATQAFLSRLSPFAKLHVTSISLIIQSYEEDCQPDDINLAYANLAIYIQQNLPFFRTLCLNLWDSRMRHAIHPFQLLLLKEGASIYLGMDPVDGSAIHCRDTEGLNAALHLDELEEDNELISGQEIEANVEGNPAVNEHRIADQDATNIPGRPRVHSAAESIPLWEEVCDEEEIQRVLSKAQTKGNSTQKEAHNGYKEAEDEEWVDAVLSPGVVDNDDGGAESWEVL